MAVAATHAPCVRETAVSFEGLIVARADVVVGYACPGKHGQLTAYR